MLTLKPLEVVALGRTPGGHEFTQFVDSIIRAHAYACGVTHDKVKTNQRTNLADGGVDTTVDVLLTGDATGWFSNPTVWQYKATAEENISPSALHDEVNKPFAAELIKKGYAYRLCICSEITPEKKTELNEKLKTEVAALSSTAPIPRVLSAGDLAALGSLFPAIVMPMHRLTGFGIPYSAWQKNALERIRTYVPVEAWASVMEAIKQHVKFTNSPNSPVFSIQGEPGVGKTRLVLEALGSDPGLIPLTLYTDDDDGARQLARALASDQNSRAIIVVDECSVTQRIQLSEILLGHKQRARVIAIDNSGERPATGAPEHWLTRMDQSVVEKVLEKNFPEVPADRRHAYADKSGGFIRMAADLCLHDVEIEAAGNLAPILSNINDYYFQRRLTPEERTTLAALSLVTRVGYKGDLQGELDDLCRLTSLQIAQVKETANRLHDTIGFVGRGGRFFYATPAIIAQVGFAEAWRRWASPDISTFLSNIPQSLMEKFNRRVKDSASPEVRASVGEFFWDWASNLTAANLSDSNAVARLGTLTEMSPIRFLPLIRRLIETATEAELLAIIGTVPTTGKWGSRRTLVWLIEKLVRFPEHFSDCERILLRLASAESEPNIANNASGIWCQIFHVFLSGTAVPFLDRLSIVKERVLDPDPRVSELAVKAFDSLFDSHFTRMGTASVVGGRLPPEDWRPRTAAEQNACLDGIISLLGFLLSHENPKCKEAGQRIAIGNLRVILGWGYLDTIMPGLTGAKLSEPARISLISKIQEYVRYDCSPEHKGGDLEYEAKVHAWLKSLKPIDFHGRLITAIGVEPWSHAVLQDEDAWKADIAALAHEIVTDPEALKMETAWLFSDAAKSAAVLGVNIGRQDPEGKLLQFIVEATLQFKTALLAKGYVSGLLQGGAGMAPEINLAIDHIQEVAPNLAYEIFVAEPGATHGFSRLISLYDAGKLSVSAFHSFIYGGMRRTLSFDEFELALERLLACAKSDLTAFRIALQLIAFELKDEKTAGEGQTRQTPILERPKIRKAAWELLNIAATTDGTDVDSYWWAEILKVLLPTDPEQAVVVCVAGLSSHDTHLRDNASAFLAQLSATCPEHVMRCFGEALLDKTKGHYMWVAHAPIMSSLPIETVKAWLDVSGVEGARAIARHLPAPALDGNGQPYLPPLTEFVLTKYEDDDKVFRSFLLGLHGLRFYSGDIASQHDAEANLAEKFLNHPLRRIREWARDERDGARQQAERWRQNDEEDKID